MITNAVALDGWTVVYFLLLAGALFAFGLVAAGRGVDQLRLVAIGLLLLTLVETLQLVERVLT
jgi:hypothetical protein